ncbi:GAF domain-containing SpoIIE family protein phosphatase [Cyclonatronum proteinivorum]|nr:GAF domain-containing SpoIIE family protein phosphatase [Cyclonatronum proteinivorum]
MSEYADPKHDCNTCTNYRSLVRKTLFFKDISNQIIEKKPLPELLKSIIDTSKKLLDAEASSLLLFDEKTGKLVFYVAEGEKGTFIKSKEINIGEGIAGWVAEEMKTVRIDDCYTDPRFNPAFDMSSGFVTRNMICAPMERKGTLIGVIQVMNKSSNRSFDTQDEQFFSALAGQCAIAIENYRLGQFEIEAEQMRTELETARSIQRKILPDRLPELRSFSVHTLLRPAKHLGGDYYNLIRINDRQALFFLTDVTGKSISAALIVSSVFSFIHSYLIIHKKSFQLKHFVESLNTFLIESTTPDKFVTGWFALLDEEDLRLTSISAGHDPVLLFRKDSGNGMPLRLNKGGLMLGVMAIPYATEELQLKPGDVLAAYTDGVTEAMNTDTEEYTAERMEQLLETAYRNNGSGEIMLRTLIEDVDLHRGKAHQSDDITLGFIEVGRAGSADA